MPAEVATWLRTGGHHAWTASQANLSDASDETLIIYADDLKAILVTTNRNCALAAQRKGAAEAVWLDSTEPYALDTMKRALEWFDETGNRLPAGRVLRSPRNGPLQVMHPKRQGGTAEAR